MTQCRLAALALWGAMGAAAQTPPFFNVKQYGAAGDGRTLDTAAIQKAIEACSAAGGGTVYFPAGSYLSGTIHLKSNLALRLEAGATILGSTNLAHYQWPPGERAATRSNGIRTGTAEWTGTHRWTATRTGRTG